MTLQRAAYSVIVPAYNAESTIGDCLSALENQSVDRDKYEIILVDDGSTDGTADTARQHGVRVFSQPNAGPAAARNYGARNATGEILMFTDADCEPAPDWIRRLAAPLKNPEVAGTKGAYRTRQRELVARFVQMEYEDRYARMSRQKHIDFVDTYSAAYQREIFLTNDGFDTSFPTASVEDQEFSFRLARKGYRMVFIPDAIVYHRHDRSLREYWTRKFCIGYWKALLLRWHPERAVRDSHTPQVVKVQIGLAGLLPLVLAASVFHSPALWLALVISGLFVLSASPFIARTSRRDPAVGLAALPILVVRALALGTGLVIGFLSLAGRESPRRPPISWLNRAIKRGMDVFGSLAGLILSGPLLVVLALAVRLDSPGSAFFVQERAGQNGRPFRMFKLRTMVTGADERLDSLVDLESLPSPAFKLHNDPRVTKVGRLLRRTSLDELPQLWNVLKGDMSLVGPRPEETRIVNLYNDWHRQRFAVKPGITGPTQVSGRGDLELDERVRLELNYIQNYSLWKDIGILVRTIGVVITGRGAY